MLRRSTVRPLSRVLDGHFGGSYAARLRWILRERFGLSKNLWRTRSLSITTTASTPCCGFLQTDLYGIAGTLHVVLHNDYMKTSRNAQGEWQCVKRTPRWGSGQHGCELAEADCEWLGATGGDFGQPWVTSRRAFEVVRFQVLLSCWKRFMIRFWLALISNVFEKCQQNVQCWRGYACFIVQGWFGK